MEYLLVQLVATMGLSAFDLTLVTVDAVKTGALPSVSGRIRRGIVRAMPRAWDALWGRFAHRRMFAPVKNAGEPVRLEIKADS